MKFTFGTAIILGVMLLSFLAASPGGGNGSSPNGAGNGSSSTAAGNGTSWTAAGNGNGTSPCGPQGPAVGPNPAGNGNAACAPDFYFLPLGVFGSPTPIATNVYNGQPAGGSFAMGDPNYVSYACAAIQFASANLSPPAPIIQVGVAAVNLQTGGLTGPAILAEDSIYANGNNLHDFPYCIALPFGAYLIPYYAADASGGAGYTTHNYTCTASCTTTAGITTLPITVTVTPFPVNAALSNGGIVLNVYGGATANPAPNTQCVQANGCEQLHVSAINTTTPSITFDSVWPSGATTTQLTRTTGFLIASGNIIGGSWSCGTHATVTWGASPVPQAPCQPGKLWNAGQTPAQVALNPELQLPFGGGISEEYSARNGSQFMICGQGQTSWNLSPGQVDECAIGFGVSGSDFYFVTTCQTTPCALNATPAPGATPIACPNNSTTACFDPTLAGASAFLNNNTGIVNAMMYFGSPPQSNGYQEIRFNPTGGNCSTGCNVSTTFTFKLNNQGTTCAPPAFTPPDASWDQNDTNSVVTNFNTSCGSANKFGDGNTYQLIPVQHVMVSATQPPFVADVECNGTNSANTPCNPGALNSTGAGNTTTNTNANLATTNTIQTGNTGNIRFVSGAVAKLRNGFYYLTEQPDHINSADTELVNGVNGGGYYQMCIRTNGLLSIVSNAPTLTWTDCAGNNAFTTSPGKVAVYRTTSGGANVAPSRFGAGSNWNGNVPHDPFCWSGATNGDSACPLGGPGGTPSGGIPVGTIPCPTNMLSNGIQPFCVVSSAQEQTVASSYNVNFTVATCTNSCTGNTTITCPTSCATQNINYNGLLLCFDCNSPFTVAEEHVVTGLTANTFVIPNMTFAHTAGSLTVTGFHPPVVSNSAANSEQIELTNAATGDILEVYQANKISGSSNCGYSGAGNCDRALVSMIYHPATQTTDTLNVLASAASGNNGYMNPLCVVLSPTGLLSVTAATGSGSTWGFAGAGPAVVQWTSANFGQSWSAGTELAGNGAFGLAGAESGNCQESQDLYTMGLTIYGNNSGSFFSSEYLWEGRAP